MKFAHTKSQLTLLIIIGLVIMILVGLVIYFTRYMAENRMKANVKRSGETAFDALPIKELVRECMKKLTEDSLALMGRQGGYLYKSQGGTLVDYQDTDEGVFYLQHDGHKVSYDIFPQRASVPPHFSDAPLYPWKSFPFETETSTTEIYVGKLGMNTMPPLELSGGPHSLASQAESYIDENLAGCADFKFVSKGYRIESNSSRTQVAFAVRNVNVKMSLPIRVTNIATSESVEFNEFSANVDIKMREIYAFTKDLIDKDISDIRFNIKDSSNNRDSMTVELVENVFPHDDLIIIKDYNSMIGGKPYEYRFGRRNRPPALRYIRNDALSFPSMHSITVHDLTSGEGMTGYDPDEDALAYSTNPAMPFELDIPSKNFDLEVSDGEFRDWQRISVTRT